MKWARRRPGVAGSLAAALVLVTVLGVSGILWKYFDAEDQRKKAETLAEDYRRKTADEAKAREEAQLAEQKAKRELNRAEGLVYAGNLLQAQLFWEAGNIEAGAATGSTPAGGDLRRLGIRLPPPSVR